MELGPNVTAIEDGESTTYLVGTAYLLEKSVREVETIEAVKPDSVCVELCKTRYDSILDENRWKKLDIFQIIRQKKVLFVLANLALAAYQRRLGEKLGVKPARSSKRPSMPQMMWVLRSCWWTEISKRRSSAPGQTYRFGTRVRSSQA